jgi:hypothetical protein
MTGASGIHLLKPMRRERAALAFEAQQAVQKALFGRFRKPTGPMRPLSRLNTSPCGSWLASDSGGQPMEC